MGPVATSSFQLEGALICNLYLYVIDYIVLIIAIWPGDRIHRPELSTVEHGSCDESV